MTEAARKKVVPKDDPVSLAREFDAAWQAADKEKANQIAEKLMMQHERAAPALRQLLATLNKPLKDPDPNGNPYSLLLNLERILCSIGHPTAVPLAEMLMAGNAPLSPSSSRITWAPIRGDGLKYALRFRHRVFDQLGVGGSPAVPQLIRLLDSPLRRSARRAADASAHRSLP